MTSPAAGPTAPSLSPPTLAPRRVWAKRVLALMLGALVVAGGAILFLFPPGQYPFYPRCYFNALTGLLCPGCGGLRAMHALLHGEFRAALGFNALFVAALPPALVLLGARIWRRGWRAGLRFDWFPARWFWAGFVIVLAFGVLRNVPIAPCTFLRP